MEGYIDIYYDGIGNMMLIARHSDIPVRGVLMSIDERTCITDDCKWIRCDDIDIPISMMILGDIECCRIIMDYGEPRIRLYKDEVVCSGELSENEKSYIAGWEKAIEDTFRP